MSDDWRLGPKGGTLLDLVGAGYCTSVRFVNGAEPIGAKRGGNIPIAHRHGALAIAHKYNAQLLIPLEIGYPTIDTQTKKTVAEGAMFGNKSLSTLRRTTPDDTMEADVELLTPSQPSQDRFHYLYLLNAPAGFWRSTTQSTDSTSPVTVGGNAPVGDAIIEMGNGTLTMGDGSAVTVAGAASTVRIKLETGTSTYVAGGADAAGFVAFNRPYGVILEPGDNTFTGTATFNWYNKWR